MNATRRRLSMAALLIGTLGMAATSATMAQGSYPDKPVRFIVPFAAGGESDIAARHVAQHLSRLKGYTVVVENMPGAGGSLGVEKGLREPADGYTFIVVSGAYIANAIASGQKENPATAVQPVIQFSIQPSVLVASQKYANLAELLDAAKKHPNKLNYGSAGIASLGHFSNEDFARLAGIQLVHIPYKGNSAAVNDLAMGQVDMMFAGVSGALAMAQSGKVRILGVAATQRIPELPDVPTLTEGGLPYLGGLWHGLIAANGVPADRVGKINQDIAEVLKDPAVVAAFKAQTLQPVGGTPEAFRTLIAKETERLQRIATEANIRTQ